LQDRVALREEADGLEELLDVGREGDDERERDRRAHRTVADALEACPPEDARDADRTDHLDRGVEDGFVKDAALVRVAVLAVDLVELGGHRLFARIRLDDRHARDLFVQEGVESRCLRTDVTERFARTRTHEVHEDHDERQRGERDQRHPHVEDEHHDDDTDERDEVSECIQHTRGEQLTNRVDVVRRTRDETADRSLVVVTQLETLHEVEQGRTQVGHRPRARDLHRVDLDEGDQLHPDDDHREENAVTHQASWLCVLCARHHLSHHERPNEVQARGEEHHHEGGVEVLRVRLHERPEPAKQMRVVRATEPLLLVEVPQRLSLRAGRLAKLRRC